MVIDRAFDHSLPRELSTGFNFTIVDEGLDRVQFTQWEMPLHWLADHYFDQHPVLTDCQPDPVLTEEARKAFAWLRFTINSVERGYLPAGERDVGRLTRLIELTTARDRKPKLVASHIARRSRQHRPPELLADSAEALQLPPRLGGWTWSDQHRARPHQERDRATGRHREAEAEPASVIH